MKRLGLKRAAVGVAALLQEEFEAAYLVELERRGHRRPEFDMELMGHRLRPTQPWVANVFPPRSMSPPGWGIGVACELADRGGVVEKVWRVDGGNITFGVVEELVAYVLDRAEQADAVFRLTGKDFVGATDQLTNWRAPRNRKPWPPSGKG